MFAGSDVPRTFQSRYVRPHARTCASTSSSTRASGLQVRDHNSWVALLKYAG